MLTQSPWLTTHIHADKSDGTFTVERRQDVEAIIEDNKELQKEKHPFGKDFRHIASIPSVILERWIIEDGVNYLSLSSREFDRLVKRKLQDPDWKWLRTA